MLLAPEHYDAARRCLIGVDLRDYDLVMSEDLEYLMEAALNDCPFQLRPKLKKGEKGRHCLGHVRPSHKMPADEASDSDEMLWILKAERTFLSYAPQPKDAEAVVQSTTEAVTDGGMYFDHFRGSNPRRSTRASCM